MSPSPASLLRMIIPSLLFAVAFGLMLGEPQWSLIGTGGGKCAVTGYDLAVGGKSMATCPDRIDKAPGQDKTATSDDQETEQSTWPELKVDGTMERTLVAAGMVASLIAALILLFGSAVFRGCVSTVLGVLVIAAMVYQYWQWSNAVDATNTSIAKVFYLWEVSWWWCAEFGLSILAFLFGLRMLSLRSEQKASLVNAWGGILRKSSWATAGKIPVKELPAETLEEHPATGRPWPVRPGLLISGALLFLYAPMVQISCSGAESIPQTGWELSWNADSRNNSIPNPNPAESEGATTNPRPMDGWTLAVRGLGWSILVLGLAGGVLAGWRWWKMRTPSSFSGRGAAAALVAQRLVLFGWARNMNFRADKDLFKVDGTLWWWATLALFALAATKRTEIGRWPWPKRPSDG